jgi:2-polyprenyl-3-methyl-5-hydroxy-6-metoxy-1,4-benzoquinol methylase
MNTGCANHQDKLEITPVSFGFSGHVFREDTYGILKRLHYLINTIRKAGAEKNNKPRILDIGCGTGINITIPIALSGYAIKGIDIDAKSIEKAKSLSQSIPNISFSCQGIEPLINNEEFDIIICSEVLEHVPDTGKFLKNVRSIMDDDGLLILTIPNGYGYFELESHIEARFPGLAYRLDGLVQQLFKDYAKYLPESLNARHRYERTREYCDLSITTFDTETTHCNKFTKSEIVRRLTESDFRIVDFRNRTFLAGNLINILLRESNILLRLNGAIANYLPKWICSGWMIAARKNMDVQTPSRNG